MVEGQETGATTTLHSELVHGCAEHHPEKLLLVPSCLSSPPRLRSSNAKKPVPGEPAAAHAGSKAHFFSGTAILLFSFAFLDPAACCSVSLLIPELLVKYRG